MKMLERWDRHNQAVMDRARTRDVAGWTIGAVLVIALNLLYIVGRLPRPVAFAATALIVLVAIVAVVRIVRRRSSERRSDANAVDVPQ